MRPGAFFHQVVLLTPQSSDQLNAMPQTRKTQKQIVIISCGKQKLARPAPARELYIGAYFKTLLGYALSIAAAEDVFILSAKYGLVRIEKRLKPYDLKMGEAGSIELRTLKRQAKRLGIASHGVIALGGKLYIGMIRKVWESVEAPLEGKGGLFQQRAWLIGQMNKADQKRHEDQEGDKMVARPIKARPLHKREDK
jgi:hypothetical protein